MFRGAQVLAVMSVLTAVLLGLHIFALTGSFASAYTTRYALAKGQSGFKPSGKALRDKNATFRHAAHHGGPTGSLHTPDRHRTAADSALDAPGRPHLRHGASRAGELGPPGTAHRRTSRASTTHCPQALQKCRS
ncbi:hypothetical protein [Streptomyces sp. NPDC060001]|uniref:hypothetical protein n=1 Tax=Streptomyces sp. NPDC060001 TaxID=3347032 RepID=UPI00369D183E